MAHKVKVVAPRMPTPSSPSALRTSGRLPDELLAEQVQRLAVFSAVVCGLWLFGVAMAFFIVPVLINQGADPVVATLEIVGVFISAAMYLFVRRTSHPATTKITVGLAYMVANAVGVALMNTVLLRGVLPTGPDVSWTAVLVLVFSMISPASPSRMLIASLIAASMDPLVMTIAYWIGLPALTPRASLLHYLPNYVCAFVAMVPSHVFQRLGRRLKEAQELGNYQLLELLGHGGMGEVWRAEHRLLARNAAIKLVRPEMLGAGTDDEARLVLRRFKREARATAGLTSPHTIEVFDFGMTSEGNFYYVMELLAGRDLESFVRDFGPMPADRALFVLRQVCHSLADAHAHGLVHRDVKPANIYLCRMGLDYDFVKVLDFGLVKYRDARSITQTLTAFDHQTSGTPAYMAPEIILGEAEVDRRADVYALGCVAYYLLTGLLVFEAETPMKMLMQHVQALPVPPSQRTELPIPAELDALVLACLEKDPNRRPQNAEELFRIACGCRTCESWGQETAREWWEKHLPELTGPLILSDRTETAGAAAAAV